MHPDSILRKLFERGERARLSGSTRTIRESFNASTSPYWRLTVVDRDAFHQRMKAASAAGGARLEWARQGGDDRPLDAVCLMDLDRLAEFLGADTVENRVAVAQRVLEPWIDRYPRVGELLGAWRQLKTIRSFGPESAADFGDALRVLDAVQADTLEDHVLRSFSVATFNDSKRLEGLDRHLDVLTSDILGAPPRHASEVFALLGLSKEPQPFLVAGIGSIALNFDESCPIVAPFVGVANDAVTGYAGSPAWVLTIENLTTFHVAAKLLARTHGYGLVIFTAGMPSPRWCKAYATLLAGVPKDVTAYHWGDIDDGGFRIAAHIRKSCIEGGRSYQPWLMDASCQQSADVEQDDEKLRKAMVRSALAAGWSELAWRIRGVAVEQEGLTVSLPTWANH